MKLTRGPLAERLGPAAQLGAGGERGLHVPRRRHLVLDVLAAPLDERDELGELHLVRRDVDGADRHPHDVHRRHGVGDDDGAARVLGGGVARLARLFVQDLVGRAGGHEVHGRAVQEHVVGLGRAGEQDLARAERERALDERARDARGPGRAVDARPGLAQRLQRGARPEPHADRLEQLQRLVDEQVALRLRRPADLWPHAAPASRPPYRVNQTRREPRVSRGGQTPMTGSPAQRQPPELPVVRREDEVRTPRVTQDQGGRQVDCVERLDRKRERLAGAPEH